MTSPASLHKSRAFVLAGGRGSRLSPLTTVIPKPLVPVGDLSIVEILVKQLVQAGITDVTVSLGYLGHLIRAVLGDGDRLGASITYTEEREPLGTAGALGLLENVEPEELVLVLNGDTLTDLPFDDLMEHHTTSGADATVVVMRRTTNIDFGVIELGPENRLAAYHEKPVSEFLVSIGVNVFSGHTLEQIADGEALDMPTFLLRLRDGGGYVRCHEAECFWLDLGRLDDLRQANQVYADQHDRFLR